MTSPSCTTRSTGNTSTAGSPPRSPGAAAARAQRCGRGPSGATANGRTRSGSTRCWTGRMCRPFMSPSSSITRCCTRTWGPPCGGSEGACIRGSSGEGKGSSGSMRRRRRGRVGRRNSRAADSWPDGPAGPQVLSLAKEAAQDSSRSRMVDIDSNNK